MPRQPEISHEEFLSHLKGYRSIFDKQNNIKGKDDIIWKEIKKDKTLSMKAESIYFYVSLNRGRSLSKLCKYFGIPEPKKTKRKRDDSPYDPEPLKGSSLANKDSSPPDCQKVELQIVCDKTDVIITSTDGDAFKTGWTDFVAQEILKQKMLPCKFNFKNKWFTKKGGFKFTGNCSVDKCRCYIAGFCDNLSKESLVIKIETQDCTSIRHYKAKRHLRGVMREIVGNQLLYQTAGEYHQNERAKLLEGKDEKERAKLLEGGKIVLPVTLSNEAALRKLRQQKQDELINYQDFKSSSLTNLKLITHCSIRLLSLRPFYAVYCTAEQIALWNKIRKYNLPLSFDDTGGLTTRHDSHGTKSKNIFYYDLVIGISGKIVSLMKALLSIHHVLIVVQILRKWLECGAMIPPEINTDGSKTLQNGVNIVFNGETFDQYNLHCFRVLIDSSVLLPACFYRQDVAHFINAFINLSCFKSANSKQVIFYTRCLGYLIQVVTLEEFKATVEAIVIVANSTLALEKSLCAEKKRQLKEVFRTYEKKICDFISTTNADEKLQGDDCSTKACQHPTQKNNNTETSKENEESSTGNNSKKKKSNELIQYIDDIFKDAINACKKDTISEGVISKEANFLHNSAFINNFQTLCYTFPSWSNVMKPLFKSNNDRGNSARSETNFGIIKKRNPTPSAIMKFLLKDKKAIDGQVVMGFSEAQSINQATNQENKSFSIMDIDLNKVTVPTDTYDLISQLVANNSESRMNSPEKMKSSKQNRIIGKTSENVQESTEQTKSRKLIRNGSNIGERTYTNLNDNPPGSNEEKLYISKKCTFKWTCPIDSCSEIILDMYLNNAQFKLAIDTTAQPPDQNYFDILVNYSKNYNLHEFYEKRAQYLYPMVKDIIDVVELAANGKTVYKCNMNVTNLFTQLMKGYPSFLEKKTCSTPNCTKSNREIPQFFESVTPIQFHIEGIENLQTQMYHAFRDQNATECSECMEKLGIKTIQTTWEFSSYFVIDVEYVSERKNVSSFRNFSSELKDHKFEFERNFELIPKELHIKGNEFLLKSVLCFSGDPKKEVRNPLPSHYYSYTFNAEKQWVKYDDQAENIVISNQIPSEKVAMIIYTAAVGLQTDSFVAEEE